MTEKKVWTVLIYANGNNELDTIIHKEFLTIRDADLPRNTNVVIQIARFHQKGRKIQNNAPFSDDNSSVCRYKIVNNKAVLIENMGKTSMADPYTFLNFLLWGSSEFPSEHLMVILSGHGFGFFGLLGDCIGNNVRFMGLKEFTEMLLQFGKISSNVIDILVFDVCYMNMVEVMYELTITSGHAVKYALMAQGNPPLDGLPWTEMINGFESDMSGTETMAEIVCNTVASINKSNINGSSLFAVSLCKNYFESLKLLMDQLSAFIMENIEHNYFGSFIGQKESYLIGISYLFDQVEKRFHKAVKFESELTGLLQNIIICPKAFLTYKNHNWGLNIFLPDSPEHYFQSRKYYDNLLFCHDNRWPNVLAGSKKV